MYYVKIIIYFIHFCIFAFTTTAQAESNNSKYDKAFADSMGADEYGMKSYVLVILKTGPEDKNITDKPKRDSLFQGHFSNMNKMAKEGHLIVAGPTGQNDKTFRGIFILNVKTIAVAQTLA